MLKVFAVSNTIVQDFVELGDHRPSADCDAKSQSTLDRVTLRPGLGDDILTLAELVGCS